MTTAARAWRLVLPLTSLALVVSACSATDSVRTPPPSSLSTAGPVCGTASSDLGALLDVSEVSPNDGTHVERSASATEFSADGCVKSFGQAPQTGQCLSADFPWVRSEQTRADDLYARGVSRVAQATFTVADKPVMKEVVLTAAKNSDLVTIYRQHAAKCGAKVLATVNEVPVWMNSQDILIGFTDSAVIALVSLDGKSVDHLMDAAIKAAAR